jgi:hypothetical protein
VNIPARLDGGSHVHSCPIACKLLAVLAGTMAVDSTCVVHGFAQSGVAATSGGVELFVIDSISRDNGGHGLIIDAGSERVTVDNSRFENNGANGVGVLSGRAAISRSIVTGNNNGIASVTSSVSVLSSIAAHSFCTGFLASPGGTITVDSSVAHGNGGNGLAVNLGGAARISNSTFTSNATGINNISGTVETRENNTVRGNTNNQVSGALTPIGGI